MSPDQEIRNEAVAHAVRAGVVSIVQTAAQIETFILGEARDAEQMNEIDHEAYRQQVALAHQDRNAAIGALNEWRENAATVQRENDRLEVLLRDKNVVRDTLNQKVLELQADAAALHVDRDEMQSRAVTAEQKVLELQAQVAAYQDEVRLQQEIVEQKKREIEDVRALLDSTISEGAAENRRLKSQQSQSANSIRQLRQNNRNLREENAMLLKDALLVRDAAAKSAGVLFIPEGVDAEKISREVVSKMVPETEVPLVNGESGTHTDVVWESGRPYQRGETIPEGTPYFFRPSKDKPGHLVLTNTSNCPVLEDGQYFRATEHHVTFG